MRKKPWVVKKVSRNQSSNKVCYPYYVEGLNYSREELGEVKSFYWLVPDITNKFFDLSQAEFVD